MHADQICTAILHAVQHKLTETCSLKAKHLVQTRKHRDLIPTYRCFPDWN